MDNGTRQRQEADFPDGWRKPSTSLPRRLRPFTRVHPPRLIPRHADTFPDNAPVIVRFVAAFARIVTS